MKLVYIAGRYSADDRLSIERNIMCAKEVSLAVMRLGHVPVVPHIMFDHLLGCESYDVILDSCMEVLSVCDYILMLPGWKDSPGAKQELEYALGAGIEVYYSVYDLESRT